MFILFMALYALFFTGLGYAVHKNINLKKLQAPELTPPELETQEDVLNYLEACSVGQPELNKLLDDFHSYINKSLQLPPSSVDKTEPDWYHNPDKAVPCLEHWKLFMRDFDSEEFPENKLNVLKHWVIDMGFKLTDQEMLMLLEKFQDPFHRSEARKIYAKEKRVRKKKKERAA